MAVAMPSLKRNLSSGNWVARKVIPADVREVFGKREAKRAWPATLSEPEAKAAYGQLAYCHPRTNRADALVDNPRGC